jgi:hypothetical protein
MTVEEQASQINWKDYKQVIDFYNSNRIYFDNYENIIDEDKISNLIDYKLHYCNSLMDKFEFNKVPPVLDQVSELLSKLDINHWNYIDSETHRKFLLGMVLGHKKKFKDAYLIFSALIKINPDHYYYRVWYNHTKLGLYNWVFNTVLVLGAILILLDIVFNLKGKLPFDISIIGFLIIGISYLAQKGLNEYFKKKVAVGSVSK